MGIIYKAINNINGKCYIGKTIGHSEETKKKISEMKKTKKRILQYE